MGRKKVIVILTSILLLLLLPQSGYSSEKPTCAVLLFHPDKASSNLYESQFISTQYAELLKRLDMFDVIDYKKVEDLLKNQNADDLEKTCSDLGCALKIGKKLDVDFVIYGIIGNVGSLYSLDTTLVNIAGGNETQHSLYDFEGTQEEFAKNAPAENIKSLFGVYEIPAGKETPKSEIVTPMTPEKVEETPEVVEPVEKKVKKLHFGPRLGVGASNDGIQFGGGFEVQFSQLSFQFLLNGDGFASGFSFYLHPEGNSPFMSLVGSYYDTENHGVDEIGRIYGLLLGYRITLDNYLHKEFAKHVNARLGVGAGYVNWDQTEPNRGGVKDGDEEIIPLFEFTLGYTF